MPNTKTFTYPGFAVTVRVYQDRDDGTWYPITEVVTCLGWANDDNLLDTPNSYPTKEAALDNGREIALKQLGRRR